MSNRFDDFCSRFGESVGREVLESICDAQCGASNTGVTITSIHQHNACNHTLTGHITYAGEVFHFVVNNGDWAGTEVVSFGAEEDIDTYIAPTPVRYTFIPNNPLLKTDRPALWSVYLLWREEAWFKEKVLGYNYDRHFAPGVKTETHYANFAKSKGMIIAPEEEFQILMNS